MRHLKAEPHRHICLIHRAEVNTRYATRFDMTNFVTYLPKMTESSEIKHIINPQKMAYLSHFYH